MPFVLFRPTGRWDGTYCQDRHCAFATGTRGPPMGNGDSYRIKAAAFHARAQCETSPRMRVQYESLAKAYLRLAEQADRNDRADLIYEPKPPKLDSEAKR